MKEHRIALDENDFRLLVAGKAVEKRSFNEGDVIKIILSDLGFSRMVVAIQDAVMDRAKARGVELGE